MRDGATRQRCYRCGQVKPAESFAWRRKARNQRDSFCRPCRAAYHREHYVANRERYIAQAAERKRRPAHERSAYLIEFFQTHPCTDCGETDPVVLEFDHLGDKSFNVGSALRSRNWRSILDEIAKCEVVCANCHRRRTARRRGSVRAMLASEQPADRGAGDRT
jgi:hypothetical protein